MMADVTVQGVTLSGIFNDGELALQSEGLPAIMRSDVGTEVLAQRKRQALE
jgi:hypothetical protein